MSQPLPLWARSKPIMYLWYAASRIGDHGRLPPFRRLTQLTDYLYVGGQVNRHGWARLQSWGVAALVNMRVEWDDRWSDIHTANYLWLPTIDGTPPALEQLERGVQFIHAQRQAGRAVYVHCAGGLGRAPTQAISYLIARGLNTPQAIKYVADRRPFIHLSSRQRRHIAVFERYWRERYGIL